MFRPVVYDTEQMVRKIDVSPQSADLYRNYESTTGVMDCEQFSYEDKFELRYWRDDEVKSVFESSGFRTVKTASFGANAPLAKVPNPYTAAYDRLAKLTDNGATQVALFQWEG